MATKSKTKDNTSVPSKSMFAETLFSIGYRFSLPKVFDDFLTMSIAACTQNSETKLSYYEDEYLETIAYYKDSPLRFEFSNAFSYLILEMEELTNSSTGNDVLGDFFEKNISNGRNGQFFTPYHICQFMASITCTDMNIEDANDEQRDRPRRILDPACGSGRMLLAARTVYGHGNEYYGIDIDRICVKMAALNMFLNGMWNSEVMCADALRPDDFAIAYRISFFPLGIFKITEKEKSMLWHLHRSSFSSPEKKSVSRVITLDSTPFAERKRDDAKQLDLF